MFNPDFLAGRYTHVSHGYRLSQSDSIDAIIDEMIRWLMDHPNEKAGNDWIEDDNGEYGNMTVESIDTRYDRNGWGDNVIVSSVDINMQGHIYRYFPYEKPRSDRSDSKFYYARLS